MRETSFSRPDGFVELDANQTAALRRVEARLFEVFERFGYREIIVPTLEYIELYHRDRIGDDLFHDLMMATVSEAGVFPSEEPDGSLPPGIASDPEATHDVVLRPDLTAPVTRWFVTSLLEHGIPDRLPVRVSCRGPVFRNVRPSEGRLKEFHQAGVERIGDSGFEADAEILELACACCRAVGLRGGRLLLGHAELLRSALAALGFGSRREILSVADAVEREARRIRRRESLPGTETGAWEQRFGPDRSAVLLTLARMEGRVEDFFHELEQRVHVPGIAAVASELQCLCARLEGSGLEIRLRAAIGRGPAYYSGFAFEIHGPDTEGPGICGGGRYDPLHRWVFNRARQTAIARGRAPETLPAPPEPLLQGAGFAFGLERLASAVAAMEAG